MAVLSIPRIESRYLRCCSRSALQGRRVKWWYCCFRHSLAIMLHFALLRCKDQQSNQDRRKTEELFKMNNTKCRVRSRVTEIFQLIYFKLWSVATFFSIKYYLFIMIWYKMKRKLYMKMKLYISYLLFLAWYFSCVFAIRSRSLFPFMIWFNLSRDISIFCLTSIICSSTHLETIFAMSSNSL